MPKGKCAAKGRFWGGIIWRKRRTNNLEGSSLIYRSREQRRKK